MAYQVDQTAVVDSGCEIGEGTRIWHFSHIMQGCHIGERCNIGQNVVVSPGVVLGNGVKVQNNVSIYTGVTCEDDVFLGPSCVFTNVINPRSAIVRKDQFPEDPGGARCIHWCQCDHCLWPYDWTLCHGRGRCGCYERCASLCVGGG